MNFLYNIAYQVLQVLIPLIVSPYISRQLGSANIGIYSYTYSIANYFAVACALGVNYYGSRMIAEAGDDLAARNKIFSQITTVKFSVSAMAILIYCIYGAFFADPTLRIYTFLQLIYILSIAIDINWFFFGLEEFRITVTRQIIVKLLSAGCIFLFVRENDLLLYTVIISGACLISELYLWVAVRKRVKWVSSGWKDTWRHLLPMVTLFIPILAVNLYRMVAKIMLGNMLDDNKFSVGQYENAEKIVMVCVGVVAAMGQVMLPRMAKLNAEKNQSAMDKYLKKSMSVMLAFSIAVAFGIWAVGTDFAPIYFGKEFVECGYVLQILAISEVLIAWSNVIRTQHLIPCKKDRVYLCAVWSGVIVSVIANFLLIPKYHALGAAMATVAAELAVCIVQTGCAWKDLPMRSFLKNLVAYIALGFVMFGAVKLTALLPIASAIILLFVQVMVGVAVYGILALIYLWFSDRELVCSAWNMVKRLLKKLHLVH